MRAADKRFQVPEVPQSGRQMATACWITLQNRVEVDMNGIRRIMVVATDIKHSREAVHYGISLTRKYDAEMVVLHVVHDPFGAEGWNLPFLSLDEDYKKALREAKK